MKGPTICRLPCGNARRTSKPSPRFGSLEGCQLMISSLLSFRRRDAWSSDKTDGIAKSLDHHLGQILRLVGHATAGAHRITTLLRQMGRLGAVLQRAGAIHHQFPKVHDAKIGRSEMLAGAVG